MTTVFALDVVLVVTALPDFLIFDPGSLVTVTTPVLLGVVPPEEKPLPLAVVLAAWVVTGAAATVIVVVTFVVAPRESVTASVTT